MSIDATTLTAQQQITAIYIAYYDRAPDPAGLQFWSDQLDGGRSLEQIATDFSSAAETLTKYPYFSTPAVSTATSFIKSVYANLFGRAPDAAGQAFWTDQLESGSTPVGEIILKILEGAQNQADGGFPDEATINNKIEAGLDWAQTAADTGVGNSTNLIAEDDGNGHLVVHNQAAFDSATSVLNHVTGDHQSVVDAEANTNSFFADFAGVGAVTLTLTAGIDALEGSGSNDTFIGSNATWNVGDNIDGGAGVDTLNIANENDDFTMSGRTITSVENLTITNVDPDSTSQHFNISNKMLDKVTVDYDGTSTQSNLYLDNMRGDTDLAVTNIVADGDYIYRNDAGHYSTLTGSVSQSNTVSNVDRATNDYSVYYENYAYFSAATELNLTNTFENFTNGGTTSTGSDEGFYAYDYVDMQADNATVNVTYNVTNVETPDDYSEIDLYVDNGSSVAVADTVNAVLNLDKVDGMYVELDTNDSGNSSNSDSVAINIGSGGLADTDGGNYFGLDDFETINMTINGDADFGEIDAYSNVGTAQTINIVANANMTVGDGTFDVADSQAVTMNISGAGDVSFDVNGDNEGLTVNAGTATGNLDLGVGSDSTYATVVTTGTGDDTVTFLNAFELNTAADAFLQQLDAGDGFDTFEIDAGDASTSEAALTADVSDFSGAVKNFEALSLTGFSAQAIDATNWGLADDVTIDGYTTGGSLTVNDAATVTIGEGANTDISLIVDGAGASGSVDDSLSVVLNSEDGGDFSNVTVANVETVNLVSSEIDTNDTVDTNTMDLIAADATTLNISGDASLDLSQTSTDLSSVDTVDASGFDAGLTIDLSTSGEAVTVTTGAGADNVVGSAQDDTISVGNGGNTVTGAGGGDQITLGSGVTVDDEDTIVYQAVTDSQGVTTDTISGFQVAVQSTGDVNSDGVVDSHDVINDVLDFSGVTGGTGSYAGEANGYGAVLTSLTGSGSAQAVLDTSTSTLYLDANGDGALDSNDMAINLTGVTDLSADNFHF